MGGAVRINTRSALALAVVFSMALSLMVLYAAPAQSQESTGILRVRTTSIDDPGHIFSYTSNNTPATFDHMHNGFTDFTVPVGSSITVTQTGGITGNWELEQIWCDGTGGSFDVELANNRVTMTLNASGPEAFQLRCNFDNELRENPPNSGILAVEKHAPDDPNQVFDFTIGGAAHSLQENERVEIRVQRDTPIEVVELDPPGNWYLQDITCDASGGTFTNKTIHPQSEHKGGSITMTVTGTQFECDFDNELEGHVPPPSSSTSTTTTTTAPPTTTTTTPPPPPPPPPPSGADTVAFQDAGGRFHFWSSATSGSTVNSFYFGNPGDLAFSGDWDCDGVETLGLYRQSDGFVYLRNSNTQGVADITFFFGNPGDIPIAGDFNNNGCDTVSIYRPSEQIFYIINRLGQNGGGLGAADYFFMFGNPGDKPFVGDFDADGTDTIGLHRESTGRLYFRNSNSTGVADFDFIFGDPGDKMIAGDWDGNGTDTVGVYRRSNGFFYIRNTHTPGFAHDDEFAGSFTGVVSINP